MTARRDEILSITETLAAQSPLELLRELHRCPITLHMHNGAVFDGEVIARSDGDAWAILRHVDAQSGAVSLLYFSPAQVAAVRVANVDADRLERLAGGEIDRRPIDDVSALDVRRELERFAQSMRGQRARADFYATFDVARLPSGELGRRDVLHLLRRLQQVMQLLDGDPLAREHFQHTLARLELTVGAPGLVIQGGVLQISFPFDGVTAIPPATQLFQLLLAHA